MDKLNRSPNTGSIEHFYDIKDIIAFNLSPIMVSLSMIGGTGMKTLTTPLLYPSLKKNLSHTYAEWM